MAVVGMLIERIVLRPVLGHPAFTVVMITIGVGYVMRGVVTMVPGWGTETYALATPFADDGDARRRRGGRRAAARGDRHDRAAVRCCCMCSSASRALGVAMQATSQNQLAAYYMGIPVRRVNMLIWGLSAGVAAFARHPARAGDLRALQHGLHRPEGLPGGGGGRLRQRAGRDRRRADHRRGRGARRASTCPRASRTSPPTWWCCWCCW